MKKTILTIFSFVLTCQFMFAGGIVTNTNQSAAWVRSMARDASVGVDAVFFNPAGLTHLEDGFYVQINSQTVNQTRTVTSSFPTLNNDIYEGTTFVPVLPTGFLVYKKGKLAVSAGFTVIGGGGSAVFDNGLPSFEQEISTLPTLSMGLNQQVGQLAGVDLLLSGYSADIEFSGSSAYYGIQAGVSYMINDALSVGIGGRYIMANNIYEGSLGNIMVTHASGDMLATDYISNLALPAVNGVKAQAENGLATIEPFIEPMNLLIDLGLGPLTLQQLLDSGLLSPEQAGGIMILIAAFGVDPDVFTVSNANDLIDDQVTELQNNIAQLAGTAALLQAQAGQLGNSEVDVSQSGSGFTPIVSVDLDFLEGKLGLALKYEHKTSMKVTTEVVKDDLGLYTDGEEVTAEMPSMISVGLRLRPIEKFRAQVGFHYYLDKDASYGRKDDSGAFVNNGDEVTVGGETTVYLNSNAYEAAAGLEYDVIDMLTLSGGFLYTASDPNGIFQSGLSYTQNTMTFGLGAQVHVLDNFDIDLGYSNTSYTLYTKSLNSATFGAYEETYDKTAWVFAAGLTYRF